MVLPAGAAKFEPVAGGVVCGRYRLGAEIGRGGFGTVHEAVDLTTSRPVAVKLLIWRASAEDASYKRFVREAELVARIRNPYVVEVIAWGQTELEQPYIVFELLHGRSLFHELKQQGALGARRTASIARQVLRGLGEAHAAGIVHRDIKPPNVFLCAGSDDDRVKVLDFGIAKALEGDEGAATRLTATGQVLGTPHFMAPEQVRGDPIDPRTDLYAFGLVMAEMLSGRRVVTGQGDIDVLMAQVSHEPLVLEQVVVESALYPVIERAVRKLPDERFASAADMLAALDAACGPASPSAVPRAEREASSRVSPAPSTSASTTGGSGGIPLTVDGLGGGTSTVGPGRSPSSGTAPWPTVRPSAAPGATLASPVDGPAVKPAPAASPPFGGFGMPGAAVSPGPSASPPFGGTALPGGAIMLPNVHGSFRPRGLSSLLVGMLIGAGVAMAIGAIVLWQVLGVAAPEGRGRKVGASGPPGVAAGSPSLQAWDGKVAFMCQSGVHRLEARKLSVGANSILSATGSCELQLVDVDLDVGQSAVTVLENGRLSMIRGSLTGSEAPLMILQSGAAKVQGTKIRGALVFVNSQGAISFEDVDIEGSKGALVVTGGRVSVTRGTLRGSLWSVHVSGPAEVTVRATALLGPTMVNAPGSLVRYP